MILPYQWSDGLEVYYLDFDKTVCKCMKVEFRRWPVACVVRPSLVSQVWEVADTVGYLRKNTLYQKCKTGVPSPNHLSERNCTQKIHLPRLEWSNWCSKIANFRPVVACIPKSVEKIEVGGLGEKKYTWNLRSRGVPEGWITSSAVSRVVSSPNLAF